jgi:hypothetical protein
LVVRVVENRVSLAYLPTISCIDREIDETSLSSGT